MGNGHYLLIRKGRIPPVVNNGPEVFACRPSDCRLRVSYPSSELASFGATTWPQYRCIKDNDELPNQKHFVDNACTEVPDASPARSPCSPCPPYDAPSRYLLFPLSHSVTQPNRTPNHFSTAVHFPDERFLPNTPLGASFGPFEDLLQWPAPRSCLA